MRYAATFTSALVGQIVWDRVLPASPQTCPNSSVLRGISCIEPCHFFSHICGLSAKGAGLAHPSRSGCDPDEAMEDGDSSILHPRYIPMFIHFGRKPHKAKEPRC